MWMLLVQEGGLMFSKPKKLVVGTTNLSTRETWLENTLKKINKGSKILDAGAGELQYKKYCSHLNYTSQDFGRYTGKGDGSALQTGAWDNSKLDILSDITTIPVKDKSFDAIMCIEVLEHLPNPEGAIKEFSRIIKKNGSLIITAPFCSMTHFSPYFYHTGFSKYWYHTVLEKYGFEIKEIKFNGNFFEYLGQETRRLIYMSEQYSDKDISKNKKAINTIEDMLVLLNTLSQKQKGSEEMLCFDLMVGAKKK